MTILPRLLIRVILVTLLSMTAVQAHEVQPAVADIEVGDTSVTVTLRAAVEPMIAGLDLDGLENTNDSPLSDASDALRALDPDALSSALEAAWPDIAARITLQVGDTQLTLNLVQSDIPPVGNAELRRDSTLLLTADLPPGDTPVVFGWEASLGSLIVRQTAEDAATDAYEALLTSGALTDPLPRSGVADVSLGETILRYVVSGFDHIVPKGLDHILFVLGLFLYSLAWRPLVWQVTSFTLAHTVTLALASLGIINIPDSQMWLVETIIAASIVYVAVENIFGGKRTTIGWGRIGVVFGFGLLHGLGFASVLSEFGLGSHFVASLISFNVGVELGQIAVIAVAFLLLGAPFGQRPWYRSVVVIPGSTVIAVIGVYWILNRIGMAGDIPGLA